MAYLWDLGRCRARYVRAEVQWATAIVSESERHWQWVWYRFLKYPAMSNSVATANGHECGGTASCGYQAGM